MSTSIIRVLFASYLSLQSSEGSSDCRPVGYVMSKHQQLHSVCVWPVYDCVAASAMCGLARGCYYGDQGGMCGIDDQTEDTLKRVVGINQDWIGGDDDRSALSMSRYLINCCLLGSTGLCVGGFVIGHGIGVHGREAASRRCTHCSCCSSAASIEDETETSDSRPLIQGMNMREPEHSR